MTRSILLALAVALPLAGCNGPAATTSPTPAATSADAMNQMDMPDGSPVDMASVPLYPGAKMVDMKIMPHMPVDAMAINFDAPAAPGVVRDWYAAQLGAKGFKLQPDATGLAGTDPSGGAVHIALEAAPGGHTFGTISKS